MKQLLLFFLLLIPLVGLNAQILSAKIIDKETKEPISFAIIKISKNEGVMSNEEGFFEYEITKKIHRSDSLEISCLGFKSYKQSLTDSLPRVINLQSDVYEITPVILTNSKIRVDEIINRVKENLADNYLVQYSESNFFLREIYKQSFTRIRLKIIKSTIENIKQKLLDSIIKKFTKKHTSLVETFGKVYTKKSLKAKTQVDKIMVVRNEKEKASLNSLQKDFMQILKENMKPNSYLIIKTGIIRLNKTEIIDSITKSRDKKEEKIKKSGISNYRNIVVNNFLKNLFINEDSEIDFINKSRRYIFKKIGYVELDERLVYVLEFKPKWRAKYKGKLYINIDDFAIIKAEIIGANEIFDKGYNFLGVRSDQLVYKSTILFSKDQSLKYCLKYVKIELVSEMGLNRSFKIIEKNKIVKGRNTQNKVKIALDVELKDQMVKEIIFNNYNTSTKTIYSKFKNNNNFNIDRFNSYKKDFWNGYTIITPEKEIKELKLF
jgi:hypothetical protein